jgi:hypothetical protein
MGDSHLAAVVSGAPAAELEPPRKIGNNTNEAGISLKTKIEIFVIHGNPGTR